MPSLFTNNALTTIQTSITDVSTFVTVNDASAFPLSVGQDYFYITLQDAIAGTHIEIAKVTNVTSNTFTIVRGQEGTTPYAFQAGDRVELRLTAKGITELRLPRTFSTTTTTTLSTNSDLLDEVIVTNLASNITISNPTGTPVDGQKLIIRITSDATIRTITWGSLFFPLGTALPINTVASKTLYVGCMYNVVTSKWDVLGTIQEA